MKVLQLTQLRKNVLAGALVTGVSALVSLGSYPLFLSYVGLEAYGIWSILGTIVTIVQMGQLGIGPALTKFTADAHGRGDRKALVGYVATANVLMMVTGTGFVLAGLFARWWAGAAFGLHGASLATVVLWAPWMALFAAWGLQLQVPASAVTGLGRLDQASYTGLLCRVASVIVTWALMARGFALGALVAGVVVNQLLAALIFARQLRQHAAISAFTIRGANRKAARDLFRLGVPVFLAGLVSLLLGPFNKLMVSRYVGVAAVSLLDIANAAGMQVRSLLEAGLRALTPEVSKAVGSGRQSGAGTVSRLAKRGFMLQSGLGAPIFGLIIAFAPPLLQAWLRGRFVPDLIPVFRIMMLGWFVSLLGVTAYYVLLGLGRGRVLLWVHFVQAAASAAFVGGTAWLTEHLALTWVGFGWVLGAGLATASLLWFQRLAIRTLARGA